MVQVQLSVADEIKALGDGLGAMIADIKSGKPITQDVMDALTPLVLAVSQLQNLGTDIKLIDNQVYLLKALIGPFEAPTA